LQKNFRRAAGLEILGHEFQAGQAFQGRRVLIEKIGFLKRIMIAYCSHSFPKG
jgi:hypothetical protein